MFIRFRIVKTDPHFNVVYSGVTEYLIKTTLYQYVDNKHFLYYIHINHLCDKRHYSDFTNMACILIIQLSFTNRYIERLSIYFNNYSQSRDISGTTILSYNKIQNVIGTSTL